MGIKKMMRCVEPVPGGVPRTRFGGQPDWIGPPQWPLSRQLQEPMRFIGQVALADAFPGHEGKMAYLFMTEDDDQYVDGTWEPEGGENAVVIQPGGEPVPSAQALASGPSRAGFDVEIVEAEVEAGDLEGSRIGGEPEFLQGEEYPEPRAEWRFLCQIDSCSLPFEVNFGDAGIAYVFVDTHAAKGRLLWQCG